MRRRFGSGFQTRPQKLRSFCRAVAAVWGVAFGANGGACPRLDGADRLYGARAATGGRRLAERMSVVMSRLLCDRWRGALQCGGPRRKNLDACFFVFRICRSDRGHRRADSAVERRAGSNGMAIGLVMGAQ